MGRLKYKIQIEGESKGLGSMKWLLRIVIAVLLLLLILQFGAEIVVRLW
jgi:hypothetical protein